jgi:hypothetical protein
VSPSPPEPGPVLREENITWPGHTHGAEVAEVGCGPCLLPPSLTHQIEMGLSGRATQGGVSGINQGRSLDSILLEPDKESLDILVLSLGLEHLRPAMSTQELQRLTPSHKLFAAPETPIGPDTAELPPGDGPEERLGKTDAFPVFEMMCCLYDRYHPELVWPLVQLVHTQCPRRIKASLHTSQNLSQHSTQRNVAPPLDSTASCYMERALHVLPPPASYLDDPTEHLLPGSKAWHQIAERVASRSQLLLDCGRVSEAVRVRLAGVDLLKDSAQEEAALQLAQQAWDLTSTNQRPSAPSTSTRPAGVPSSSLLAAASGSLLRASSFKSLGSHSGLKKRKPIWYCATHAEHVDFYVIANGAAVPAFRESREDRDSKALLGVESVGVSEGPCELFLRLLP